MPLLNLMKTTIPIINAKNPDMSIISYLLYPYMDSATYSMDKILNYKSKPYNDNPSA